MMTRPPLLACALYRLALQPGDEAELGDLVEEYSQLVVPELGVRQARWWFWQQVVRSIAPSLTTPLVRSGVRGPVAGLCVGALAFFGIGLVVATLVNGFPNAAYAPRFALYILLSGVGAYAAGRIGAVFSRDASAPTALALVVLALTPQAVGLLAGTSTEPAFAQALWAIAIPLGILSGSRTGALRQRPRTS